MTDSSPHAQRPLSPAEGFARSPMSFDEVWTGFLAMGGTATREQVRAALDDDGRLDDTEHDRLAAAINEHFLEVGEDHPVGYHDEPEPDRG